MRRGSVLAEADSAEPTFLHGVAVLGRLALDDGLEAPADLAVAAVLNVGVDCHIDFSSTVLNDAAGMPYRLAIII